MSGTDGQAHPAMLGRYRILRRLGTGGMAEVFLAKSAGAEGLEKVLVVKRVLPSFARSAKFIQMFVGEAKVAMRLNHPNIVQVYAFEQGKGEFLLAMEFVDGLDLGRLISAAQRAGLRVPAEMVAYVVMEMAKGLDYAHKRRDEHGEPMDIVHRDVSPQNVLLSFEGIVKVADFGIAKARMVSEETGVIKGKFAYMSPEQARGERVDRRSDVYSIGVVLAELLMGRSMYPGLHGLDVLDQVRLAQITLPSQVDESVSAELDAIVGRATAADPEERYQTARSLASALAQFLHHKEEVYDGEALERFIAEVAPRERTRPGASARSSAGSFSGDTLHSMAVLGPRESRERRRVVVVAGQVRADDDTDAPGVGDAAAQVLADIAYKADAVLTWPEGAGRHRFRLIIGLGKASVHDPLRAARLALDVLEAFHGLSADLLSPVQASMGLSRGTVSTARDANGRLLRYEPVGSCVQVAEQLATAGAAGEVLAPGEVYRLTRRDYAFDEQHIREVQVATEAGSAPRGIRAYRLRGGRTREERAAELEGSGGGGLVGRDESIAAIATHYREAVASGRTHFGSMYGELGVGKTAVVAEVLSGLEPAPRVLRAECTYGGAEVPFSATAELVRDACGIPDDTPSEQARELLAAVLEKLVPEPRYREEVQRGLAPILAPSTTQPGVDAGDRPEAILRAVELLLRALAERGPLFVWIDALQWCDGPSLDLMRTMLQRGYDVPCLVFLVSRTDPRADGGAFAAVPGLELAELSPEDARTLVRRRVGGVEVPKDVEKAIVERAGGNPFFIIELIDALLERGVVYLEGEGEGRRLVRKPGAPIALPTTLEGVIAARLDELDKGPRRVLRWLSVAGSGVRAADLVAVLGGTPGADLDALVERGLVRRRGDRGDHLDFANAVVRQVAYEAADPHDRARMHRRFAHRLREQGVAAPARIARHLERAGDDVGAAKAYMEAAEAARKVYSNREAMRFFGRVLALAPPQSPQRFHAHAGREQILRFVGRTHERLRELEAMRALAESSADLSVRAMAISRHARFEIDGARTVGVEQLLDDALEAASAAQNKGIEVDTLRLQAELFRDLGEPRRALEACDRALTTAGLERALLPARGSVLVHRGILLRRTGRLDEAVENYVEAVVIFRRLGIKRQEAFAFNSLGVALAASGSYEDAIAVIRASIRLDRQTGDRLRLGRKMSNVGQLYGHLGDQNQAIAFVQRALDVFEVVDDGPGRCDALCAMAEMLLEGSGDLDAAQLQLDHARRVAERIGGRYELARERLVRANLHRLREDFERAAACAREAVTLAREDAVIGYELFGLATLADAMSIEGDAEEALDAARDVRDRLDGGAAVERVERLLLMLCRVFERLGHEEEATAILAVAEEAVDARVATIRDPALLARYLATADVRGVREARP